jgi:DNA adenine methylase Dam
MKKYVKSPIFYMGNKYKLLPQIMPLFPKEINTFYDLFGGSGCMSANVDANKIVYEINDNIVNLYKLFLKYKPEEIDGTIKEYIHRYNLNTEGTDVRQNTPDIKEIRDYYNKNYINFRKAYNESDRNNLMLYTLTFYSFSNLIRFNGKSEFNMPYGNRCYCNKHYEQIKDWYNLIKNKNIEIKQEDAFDILQDTIFEKDDFIYLDPPYSNTLAIYNEKRAFGGWTVENDLQLFEILEKLDKCGIKWGLSNVFKNKGFKNQHLIEWCDKNNWNVYHLNNTYSALGKGNAKSDEVYICNYDIEQLRKEE